MSAPTISIRKPSRARAVDRPARPAGERALPQLGLRRIIAVWAAAALPMGLLAWVVSPELADHMSGPAALPRALLITLTGGLIWQFVLVMILVAREQGSLRFSVLREALVLRAPRSPKSGRRGGRVWLALVPLIVVFGIQALIPAVPGPVAGHDFATFLDSDAGQALFAGSWSWFAVIVTLGVFNTVLGEELLFRGYLLPRMNGVFGRRDWYANAVLFATYHLHMPWTIPANLLLPVEAYSAKRYRSTLMGIAVHSAQTVVILGLTLSLVLKG